MSLRVFAVHFPSTRSYPAPRFNCTERQQTLREVMRWERMINIVDPLYVPCTSINKVQVSVRVLHVCVFPWDSFSWDNNIR